MVTALMYSVKSGERTSGTSEADGRKPYVVRVSRTEEGSVEVRVSRRLDGRGIGYVTVRRVGVCWTAV